METFFVIADAAATSSDGDGGWLVGLLIVGGFLWLCSAAFGKKPPKHEYKGSVHVFGPKK